MSDQIDIDDLLEGNYDTSAVDRLISEEVEYVPEPGSGEEEPIVEPLIEPQTASIELDEIKINPAYKSMIPPLSAVEYEILEKSIIEEGCRDPITLWLGTIVDGHNRYEICTKHGIPFKKVHMIFENTSEAEDWIDANQLGRRNLSPDSFKLLLGRRYNRTKKDKNENLRNGVFDTNLPIHQIDGSGQNAGNAISDKSEKTAETLAKQHGVSKATVERAGKFSEEVEANPDLQEAIKTGVTIKQVKKKLRTPEIKDVKLTAAEKIKILREALIGLVGSEDPAELKVIEDNTRTGMANKVIQESDGNVMIRAVQAIFETA